MLPTQVGTDDTDDDIAIDRVNLTLSIAITGPRVWAIVGVVSE